MSFNKNNINHFYSLIFYFLSNEKEFFKFFNGSRFVGAYCVDIVQQRR